MKIGQKFNTLTLKEYFFYIDNHKRYSDFNTLGLYRSLLENKELTDAEKIEVREYAHSFFYKTFDFLQLKDPVTYYEVSVIGQELTVADTNQIWKDIKAIQQKILADKKIKHRNFGTYSKHLCGHDNCAMNGLMIKRGSAIAYDRMCLPGDKNRWQAKLKSYDQKVARKNIESIIQQNILLGK
ncbi:hypothetical protein VF13_42035 [Nostoc linckia z16]|nr:hypothetical protein VF12_40610 [Nostoc linckia z15]PHK27084.1 hypothetical protein VF13_42035 [Nostoc linckia z16]